MDKPAIVAITTETHPDIWAILSAPAPKPVSYDYHVVD